MGWLFLTILESLEYVRGLAAVALVVVAALAAFRPEVRRSGLVRAGAGLALVGVGPLLLVGVFGPEDANPIGLGLLFFVAAPTAVLLMVVGTATSQVTRWRQRP